MTEPLTMAAPPATHPAASNTPAVLDSPTPELTESTSTDPAAELTALRDELAGVRTELDRVRRMRDIRDGQLTEFKDTVAHVAMKYARRNDWCSEVIRALDELGLEPPELRVTREFTVTYRFDALLPHRNHDRLNEQWIADSINVADPSFDADWSDVDMDLQCVTVDHYDIDDED